jgi:hypothetical protein
MDVEIRPRPLVGHSAWRMAVAFAWQRVNCAQPGNSFAWNSSWDN